MQKELFKCKKSNE